jgi:anti-sigma regulatory factor (Ser/Thr protein kinase)
MTLELNATPQEVMRAVDWLREFGRQRGVREQELFRLALMLEESASNIVNYGLRGDPEQKFSVTVEYVNHELSIELRDRGPEFDPTRAVEIRKPDDERPGGLGLHLVRHYADQMLYRREAGENVLRLTRKLGESSAPASIS